MVLSLMTIINYNWNSDIFIKSIHVSVFPKQKSNSIKRKKNQCASDVHFANVRRSIERANQYEFNKSITFFADGNVQAHIRNGNEK